MKSGKEEGFKKNNEKKEKREKGALEGRKVGSGSVKTDLKRLSECLDLEYGHQEALEGGVR